MEKTLDQIEKKIAASAYFTVLTELEAVLNEVNNILLDHFIVQRERTYLRKVVDFLYEQSNLPKEIVERISACRFELIGLLSRQHTLEKTQTAVRQILAVLRQVTELEPVKQNTEIIASFDKIFAFLQILLDKKIIIQPERKHLDFPLTIDHPVIITQMDESSQFLVEFPDRKKFAIVHLEVSAHDDEVQIEGLTLEDALSLASIKDCDSEVEEDKLYHKTVYFGDTPALLQLQCIPTPLRERYAQRVEEYHAAKAELDKLMKWRKSVKCSLQLSEKFAETP